MLDAQPRRHGEQADVVGHAALPGRDEVGQALVGHAFALDALLAQIAPGKEHFAARLVLVDLDVLVVDGVGRIEAHHAVGLEPAALDDLLEHGLPFLVHLARLLAHHLVLQDGGEMAEQAPGIEERAPVHVLGYLGQVVALEGAAAQVFGPGRRIGSPIYPGPVGARLGQGNEGRGLAVGVAAAHVFVFLRDLGDVGIGVLRHQAGRHGHGAAGVGRVDHRPFVVRRDLHRGVHAAGGGPAYHQRDLAAAEVFVALHFGGDVGHLFQAGRDEAGQADDVGLFLLRHVEDLRAGHHHAHVHHLEVIALHDHGHDVLADVVHVALDRGDDHLALGAHVAAGGLDLALLFLDEGNEMGHGLLHHARRLHHLGQEHLALAEQVAHDVHAVHERALDDLDGPAAARRDLLPHLFGVLDDEAGDAVHQRVLQALLDLHLAPGQIFFPLLAVALDGVGELHQALGGRALVGIALLAHGIGTVQDHVLDQVAQLRREIRIHAELAGVDDAHGQAGLDGVIQEDRVYGLAHGLVAAEREAHVRDAARDAGMRQVLAYPARALDEIDRVVVVLVDAGRDREDVRIEDDVLGREALFLDQNPVGLAADFLAALVGVGLALLVEGHDHHGRAVAAAQARVMAEDLLAFLHGDRVDHGLALHALQAGLDHFPLGAVYHHRDAGDVGLGGDQVQEALHARDRIEHGLVHIDVDDLRAVLDLLARHGQGLVVLLFADQAREHLAARDVGALAHVHEQRFLVDVDRFQARQARLDGHLGHGARGQRRDLVGDGADVVGRGAAAAAGHIDQAGLGEFLQQARRVGRTFVEARFRHGIGQAGIGVDADVGVADLGQLGHVGPHQRRAQRAVQAYGDRAGVAHRVPEGLDRLARENAARSVGDGAGDHHGQTDAPRFEHLFHGVDGRFGIERVEDGFDQHDVDAAVEQAVHLLDVGEAQFVESDVARARVVDVGGNGGRLGLRAQCARHETGMIRRAVAVAGGAGQLRRDLVQLIGQLGQIVVALGHRSGAEGVGLDHVGAGRQVLLVDLADDVGPHQRQQLVVALEVLVMVLEAIAAEVGLGQLVALDHGAHRAVQDQDALAQPAREFGAAGIGGQGIGQLGIGHDGESWFQPGARLRSGLYRHGS